MFGKGKQGTGQKEEGMSYWAPSSPSRSTIEEVEEDDRRSPIAVQDAHQSRFWRAERVFLNNKGSKKDNQKKAKGPLDTGQNRMPNAECR